MRAARDDAYQIAWGQGSDREYFITDSADLAGLLATMPRTTTVIDARRQLEQGLRTSTVEAATLVGHLVSYGYWLPEPAILTLGERSWLDVGWEDALDLHMATRGMIWSHDYSGNPQVMTRYHVTKNVQPDSPRPMRRRPVRTETVSLPEPTDLGVDYWRAHDGRRTSRDFRTSRINIDDVATILGLTFKPRFPASDPYLYTSQSYSLGAPFHAYLITGMEGAPEELRKNYAVYHYDSNAHELGLIRTATELDQFDALLWRQSYVNHAPIMLVICVDWQQYMWKYRFSRAYRFVLTECGAFMQTALLIASALGLKAFQTPAMNDIAMCKALDVADHEIAPLYVATFGRH
ncbi:hypothetical protein Pflav_009490 [Phytohabitans flavus]|uniref:Nitroreductase domain-containing protein n=1 Tax=Phytohabitans flavus TaxID=1076124 RepID=A0A6F8XL76_9ACTN|nr:SagB/ThcOx family dehydrogenase [Phytohabitans flavus]BCB74539.1 hypothetical protein Pflav_009490 [Phytohabitans flavus]